MTDAKKLQAEIQKRSLAKLGPLFSRYQLDHDTLESALKWKSIVLLLGNFSSGKSTLINELFGTDIQRTGQSPTDDSFTILTAPEGDSAPQEIPGSGLLNNDQLPFTSLKKYGEQFTAHFTMKQVDSPPLENMAIIDTPGMLDAVTEKDRGYDYNGVVGDLARLADLVVLMFDPHKSGTIREVYETIRNTLPGNSGEDRVIFVMSRIDECDNPADLIRSYGTLCWNLSQMTGRKDIPRIFMTYSDLLAKNPEAMGGLNNERSELKEKILAAPSLRINHILQHIDTQAHELRLMAEAFTNFSRKGRILLRTTGRITASLAIFFFLFLDIIIREFTNLPANTLISSLISGTVGWQNLLLPLLGAAGSIICMSLLFSRFQFVRLKKQAVAKPTDLVDLDTDYDRQQWARMEYHVKTLLGKAKIRDIIVGHQGNLNRIDQFINKDLREYFKKISES
jgi:EH domain-containing protein 1